MLPKLQMIGGSYLLHKIALGGTDSPEVRI